MTTPRPGPRERGSAAVWAVLLVAVLTSVAALAVAYGVGVALRHRADAAADLAALAAAGAVLDGPAAACAEASDIADRNGARLVSCAILGEVADVEVVVAAAQGGARFAARSRSRAGTTEPGLAGLADPLNGPRGTSGAAPTASPPGAP